MFFQKYLCVKSFQFIDNVSALFDIITKCVNNYQREDSKITKEIMTFIVGENQYHLITVWILNLGIVFIKRNCPKPMYFGQRSIFAADTSKEEN